MAAGRHALVEFGRQLATRRQPDAAACARCPTTCWATSASGTASKGRNARITNHSIGGLLAVVEAFEALRNGEADRRGRRRPRRADRAADAALLPRRRPDRERGAAPVRRAPRFGSVFGEGAAALVSRPRPRPPRAARPSSARGARRGGCCEAEGCSRSATTATASSAVRDGARRRRPAAGRHRHGRRPRQRHCRPPDASGSRGVRSCSGRLRPRHAVRRPSAPDRRRRSAPDAALALAALGEPWSSPARAGRFWSRPTVWEAVSPAAQAPRSDIALVVCRAASPAPTGTVLRVPRFTTTDNSPCRPCTGAQSFSATRFARSAPCPSPSISRTGRLPNATRAARPEVACRSAAGRGKTTVGRSSTRHWSSPKITVAGLGIGQYGDGVQGFQGRRRLVGSARNTSGASHGHQAGAQQFTDAMFLMNEKAVAALDANDR